MTQPVTSPRWERVDEAAEAASTSEPTLLLIAREQVELFGCRIDRVRMSGAVRLVYNLLDRPANACPYVVTPNVDHVVMLEHNPALRAAYDGASLVLPDGMPVVLASRLLGRGLPERVTGADLVPALFDAAPEHGGLRVYLLGALPGVAEVAAQKIAERWSQVRVVGTYSPPLGFEHDPHENQQILARIAQAQPDVLVIGLGAPKQELWVHAHRQELEAGVALCVGATIDFLAGNKSRAPRWMQKSGLEWLHRVLTEPRRLIRRYASDAWRFPGIVWREWRATGRGPASTTPVPHIPGRAGDRKAKALKIHTDERTRSNFDGNG